MENVAPILFLQQFSSPALDIIATILANFTDLFFIVAVTLVYWCIDKNKGEQLGYIAVTNMLFSTFLKDVIRLPRPIGREGVISLAEESAPGFSFPSMHTQVISNLTATTWYFFRKPRLTIALFTLTVLMGVSRIYLGVHYLTDVFGGLFFGILAAFICISVLKRIRSKIKIYCFTILLSAAFLFTKPSAEYLMLFCGLCSFALGILFEKKFVRLKMPSSKPLKILRFAFGISVLLLIYIGFKLLGIPNPIRDILRYSLIVFSAVGLIPYCFKIFNI